MTLRKGDLRDLVYRVFEIDSYASKMGADKDIVTLSFSVKNKDVAEDLVGFLEKGYNFILDADNTSGEQADGTYKVFVELERNKEVSQNIMEIASGLEQLAALDDLKFRYYKSFKSKPLSQETLDETVPNDPDYYETAITESQIENYKNFFNRSYVESVDMLNDFLIVNKKYADPLAFKFIDFGPTQETLDSINESFNPYEFAEIIFLSKYVGDYNITKYGNKLTFENEGHTLVVERLQN